jgi:integrase
MDLSIVKTRSKLKLRREPYWHKLASGCFLGYRPSSVGSGGTWVARYRDAEEYTQKFNALGDFGDLPPNERFSAAQKAAREWLEHVSSGGSGKPISVRKACEHYGAGRPEAQARFKRHVFDDPIALVPLPRLTDRQVRNWRTRLENKPALASRSKRGQPVTRKRSAATVNRDMTVLRAALNKALLQGDALTDRAWRAALRPSRGADNRRNLYLDRAQRRALIDALPADAAAFVRGLCLLPLRPGALAALLAGDFDARRSELMIMRDKEGAGRSILLPREVVVFFKEQSRNKLPTAHLFTRADGKPWNRDTWKIPIKAAARKAGLPEETTAYPLRHAVITDLVTGGLDLMTVAQVSGTSVAMIERHYAHLQREKAASALATLVL